MEAVNAVLSQCFDEAAFIHYLPQTGFRALPGSGLLQQPHKIVSARRDGISAPAPLYRLFGVFETFMRRLATSNDLEAVFPIDPHEQGVPQRHAAGSSRQQAGLASRIAETLPFIALDSTH